MKHDRNTMTMRGTFKIMLVCLTMLFATGMVSTPASAGQVEIPAAPARTNDAGIWLAGCKPPPLPTRGCIRNPCDGKYICCSEANGQRQCVTKDPPKKK